MNDSTFSWRGAFLQQNRLLRLTSVAGPEALLAERVLGTEEISRGYGFDIWALSLDANIALKSLIGQPALLELQTTASRTEFRPFHGHVTAVERIGANGGLARYRLRLEPWQAFLAYTRDSTTYQDMTVFDILDSVFSAYQGQGKLSPVWRFDIEDPSIYPRRSLTTQYQESDLDFVQRLMLEEGLFFWYEHTGDTSSTSFGVHTLVIADHNSAFTKNAQSEVRFTQSGAAMREDSLDQWRGERRWHSNAIELQSWDYRTLSLRPASAVSALDHCATNTPLTRRDVPGQYGWETAEQGQRLACMRMQAIEASNKRFYGAGTVRTFSPGTTFVLRDHVEHDLEANDDARQFAVLRVHHLMHNNLSADLQADVAQCLGHLEDAPASPGPRLPELTQVGDAPEYRNSIEAIRAAIPYRTSAHDNNGRLLHPKPNVAGQQTAIVVGPAGAVIHTDRDHRIKIQLHWQRGQRSHSRLTHPDPTGHTNAPADDSAGTWVRVAAAIAPIAGANWGGHGVPRIGQEVLVDFLEGDIDRPIIIGTLYNGQGKPDAQHNLIMQGSGSATGNAPAWFAGESGAHAHGAAFSGIKTQSLESSQTGNGAYNQLVFDDSKEQSRLSLQHHAQPHTGTAELNLGNLRHQTDNQRLQASGLGIELKAQHSVALRAGQGILLTSDVRPNVTSTQLDSREAQAQVAQSHALQESLAQLAQQHNAKLKDDPDAVKLDPIVQLAHAAEVLAATETGIGSEGKGGQGTVTAWSEPQLQLSSPAGIATTTPADVILAAGNSTSITTGQDINTAAQGNSAHLVAEGISLFTYGKAQDPKKPNQETGIKLHAATGKVSTQSQSDQTKVTADKDVTVQGKEVKVSAQKHALLTAMGAFIRIEGGNITVAAPGKVEFKAGVKEFAGPGSAQHVGPVLPKGVLASCPAALVAAVEGGASAI